MAWTDDATETDHARSTADGNVMDLPLRMVATLGRVLTIASIITLVLALIGPAGLPPRHDLLIVAYLALALGILLSGIGPLARVLVGVSTRAARRAAGEGSARGVSGG